MNVLSEIQQDQIRNSNSSLSKSHKSTKVSPHNTEGRQFLKMEGKEYPYCSGTLAYTNSLLELFSSNPLWRLIHRVARPVGILWPDVQSVLQLLASCQQLGDCHDTALPYCTASTRVLLWLLLHVIPGLFSPIQQSHLQGDWRHWTRGKH